MGGFIKKLEYTMEHENAHRCFSVLIILNAIVLGIETIPSVQPKYGAMLFGIDQCINYIFVIEVLLRILGSGKNFFKNGWNVFDFIVIGGSMISFNPAFSAFRTLRILRLTEIMSLSKHMRIIVKALVSTVPGVLHMLGVMGIIFYIFSLVAHDIFAASNPDIFGSFSQSMLTLLLILLGDGVGDTIHATMASYQYSFLFFIFYTAVMSFTFLNLLFGIVIDAVQSATEEENNAGRDDASTNLESYHKETIETLQKLQKQVDELADTVKSL